MLLALTALVLAQSRPDPDWLPLLDAPKSLTSELAIAKPASPGPQIEIRGRVFKADGRTPAPGVILYFHHTDARGIYPRPSGADPKDWSYWHGTLRGWLKTDSQGRWLLKTTKPAPYPGNIEPAHIHVYGLKPGSREGFYWSDIVFTDDPLVGERYWQRVRSNGQDAYGGVALSRGSNGVLRGSRDLRLRD
jgi:protocatechuate 3,4-dioxygenase beta subunit